MKNIFHLGCSWSEANGSPDFGGRYTLPYFITTNLIEKGIDINYYSPAMGGCGLGTQLEILLKILEEETKIDLVIVEITTNQRFHGQRQLPNKIVWEQDNSHPNILECKKWIIDNYVFWMPIYKEMINHHWYFMQNKRTVFEIAKNYNSSIVFNWDSIFFSRIVAIKNLLKKNNIPFIIYGHDRNQSFEDVRPSLEKEIYENLDFFINEQLGSKLFKRFSIDRGCHMSVEGDKFIAENIMVPKIIDKLK
jgi:hypothetical protein